MRKNRQEVSNMSTIKGQKIQAAGNWKSLQISSQLRDQGLLGIEELTDYSMVKVKKNPKSKLVEAKKTPTPGTVSDQMSSSDSSFSLINQSTPAYKIDYNCKKN